MVTEPALLPCRGNRSHVLSEQLDLLVGQILKRRHLADTVANGSSSKLGPMAPSAPAFFSAWHTAHAGTAVLLNSVLPASNLSCAKAGEPTSAAAIAADVAIRVIDEYMDIP